jgi:ElaB/YqjD/DUF883 family membrane-anchored ribosome-binding protein
MSTLGPANTPDPISQQLRALVASCEEMLAASGPWGRRELARIRAQEAQARAEEAAWLDDLSRRLRKVWTGRPGEDSHPAGCGPSEAPGHP